MSSSIESNWLVFISGQVHADKDWNIIGDNIEEKFEIILKRIDNILKEAGLEIKDIIKINIYIKNISELPDLNTLYTKYFKHPMPVRTAIGVKELPLNADLEIEAIASRDNN